MPRIAIRLIPAIAAGLLAASLEPSAVAAEKKKATPVMAPAPPPAMPQNVKAPRGRKTEIPLRTFGRHNEQLRYVIQSRPAHGKLSAPRITEREVSMVTYEPPRDLAVKSDRFFFSVKTSVGVSAPVEVNITIVDEDPVLTIPGGLEFGTILAGAKASKEFELANVGGGLADGEIKVPPPWKLEGPIRYQLAGGEATICKIIFTPGDAGDFRGEIVFTSHREHTTALTGSAAKPVSAEPPEIVLRHEPGFALRTGVFEVVNRTDEARTFRLSSSPRLRVEPQIAVPARGRLAVAVNTEATDVAPLDDSVNVDTDGFSLRVPVKAPAVGPILRVRQPRVSLGHLPADRGGQVAFEVENVGGTPAGVVSEVGAPFVITPATFLLPPGEKRQVMLAIQPAEPGPYRGWLKLKAAPVNLEVEIDAHLSASSRTPRSPAAGTRPRSPDRTRSEADDEPPAPPMPDMNIARAIRVSEVSPTSARLEWPAEMTTGTRFRVERALLGRDASGGAGIRWVELPQVTTGREGTQWVARVAGLKPSQPQTLRVVTIGNPSKPGQFVFKIDFLTPAQPPGLRGPSLLQWLVGALAVCLGIALWNKRRSAGLPRL